MTAYGLVAVLELSPHSVLSCAEMGRIKPTRNYVVVSGYRWLNTATASLVNA